MRPRFDPELDLRSRMRVVTKRRLESIEVVTDDPVSVEPRRDFEKYVTIPALRHSQRLDPDIEVVASQSATKLLASTLPAVHRKGDPLSPKGLFNRFVHRCG